MSPPPPRVIDAQRALADAVERLARPRVLVPTMGALHAGHLDLVDKAASVGGSVIVSVFVNPLQFGPNEDFDAYPRHLAGDLEALAGRGVDLVYAPTGRDMYPLGAPRVTVQPGPAGSAYEGKVRPGHFAGVLTVVAKLLLRTRADIAVFGRKDAQQVALVRQMVADLDLPVELVVVPTRRDPDGLALSSRNAYLTAAQRSQALALPAALSAAASAAADAVPLDAVKAAGLEVLGKAGGIEVDYFDIVRPDDFQAFGAEDWGQGLAIGAIRVGTTRLIDNWPIGIVGKEG
ncbi:MAG: pantoate--beta-alanine ligase [Bifidobacteriaceae bacterium]|nr:pantoate--beta-alanine ligase [Bifidobacteriaceae bacterium]